MEKIFLGTLFYLIVLARPTQAYLDPGTGSYITQIMVGFLIGGSYMFKVYFHQIADFFKKIFRKVFDHDTVKKS